MTRIGILISALIFRFRVTISRANFPYSFDELRASYRASKNSGPQPADSVTITASPIGGLGEYAPGII